MKTIGIFTSDHGHGSISQAITEKIIQHTKNKYKIKTFVYDEPFNLLYDYMYKLAPGLFGLPFNMTSKLMEKNDTTKQAIELWFTLNNENKIREFIEKNDIDLAISAYLGCNPVLEKIQEEKGIPLINFVADPKTVHPLSISEKAKINFVFDDFIIEKHKKKNMIKSGWFVRSKFEEEYQKNEIRKKLNINDDLTILVSSGSEGSSTILKILPSIINCSKKVNFIIACGKNKFLYNNVVGIKSSLDKLSSSEAKIIPVAYTKDMHLYMQAADLVIGKAGPNTLFESVACETPFFAITHIHGQEDGNLEVINEYKLGIAEENAKKANQKLQKLINNPKKLKLFSKSIKKLKKYNQNSINILLKEIDRLIKA